MLPQSFIALFSALLFVSHPIQTQAVTYIVQRFTSLATFFYLLSLVMYIKVRLEVKAKVTFFSASALTFYILSLISAILAMKTKEIAFTLPLIITFYEFMFFDGKIKRRLLYLIPILLTMFIIPLSLISIDKPIGDAIGELREASQETETISRSVYLLTQFRVIITYIRLLFLPINQNLDYDYPLSQSFFEPKTLLSFLFLISIFGFAIYLFMRSRKTGNGYGLIASFGIFWFFITLSVESSVIPIKDVIFEHRVYLPSVGAIIFFSYTVFFLFDYWKIKNIIVTALVLFAVIVVPFGITAYKRNFVWKDELRLWEDVVKKSPNKARGYYNVGKIYADQEQTENAIEKYQYALKLKPDFVWALNNLGNIYSRQEKLVEAVQMYKKSLRINSLFVEAHYNLGNTYIRQGHLDEAVLELKEAIRLNPNFIPAYLNLGNIYYINGQLEKAVQLYKEILILEPNHIDAHLNLGLAYQKLGLKEEAIKELQQVLKIQPNHDKANLAIQSLSK